MVTILSQYLLGVNKYHEQSFLSVKIANVHRLESAVKITSMCTKENRVCWRSEGIMAPLENEQRSPPVGIMAMARASSGQNYRHCFMVSRGRIPVNEKQFELTIGRGGLDERTVVLLH